ncbi:BCCT family transporter [Candidatus Formimonas warabiya]|uniref:Transporter n=1 Tax=Formimonas warabiya TaxID=1761012 RepID=A0A3G1KZS0_FORW1|nr:BCCT family transporter [Candidatus Formimonas warabiya]ATW27891.1 transporter [Candidatus Formimonas warabiya]
MEEKNNSSEQFKPRDIKDVTKNWGFLGRLDSSVFVISVIICFGFIFWGAIDHKSLGDVLGKILSYITTNWGWMFLGGVFFFVLFLFGLAFSKYGKVKLGKDGDVPEYSNFSWFAMLFGCGMGVGLIFWAVAEPVYHYLYGPTYAGAHGSVQAAEWSMAISFFHWGLSAWAVYVIVAIPIGILVFRKGMPALISTCFYPVLGDKIYGPIGKAIDIMTLVLTFFGMSTTIGLGTMELGAGITYKYGVASGLSLNVIILFIVTACYLASACLPIERGIKIGSDISMIATLGLMLFLFLVGPTKYILDNFVNATGLYIQNFVHMSMWSDPVEKTGWLGGWTVFYWAWWITWAPFVGMFIAKISKGRTIKEVVLAALVVPTLFDMAFFDIFGSTSVSFELAEATKGVIEKAISNDIASAIYVLFNQFPLSDLIAPIILFVCFTFFVVSADSCTLVLGMLSSGGDENPRTGLKIMWGIAMACSAGVLLALGGLNAVQTIAIVASFPFTFVMFGMCYTTMKLLRHDHLFQSSTGTNQIMTGAKQGTTIS